MNELDESFVSIETRKKRRQSGFRYSSKKVLQRSRVQRETSKVGRIQLESVTKALAFPSEIVDSVHHDCALRSSLQPFLDSVEEHDGDGIELTCGHASTFDISNIKVSNMSFFTIILISKCILKSVVMPGFFHRNHATKLVLI